MTEKRLAKAGKLISVEKGQYSEHQVIGFFVVLRDFDPVAESEIYLAQLKQEGKNLNEVTELRFLAALIAKGFLLEVDYGTLDLTDYYDDMSFSVAFTPGPNSQ